MEVLKPGFSLMNGDKKGKTPEEIARLKKEIELANLRMQENKISVQVDNENKIILKELESLDIEFSALDALEAHLSENPNELEKSLLELKMKDVAKRIEDIEKIIERGGIKESEDRLELLKARLSLLEFGNLTKKASDEEAA